MMIKLSEIDSLASESKLKPSKSMLTTGLSEFSGPWTGTGKQVTRNPHRPLVPIISNNYLNTFIKYNIAKMLFHA